LEDKEKMTIEQLIELMKEAEKLDKSLMLMGEHGMNPSNAENAQARIKEIRKLLKDQSLYMQVDSGIVLLTLINIEDTEDAE
jgi:hypothetical protein